MLCLSCLKLPNWRHLARVAVFPILASCPINRDVEMSGSTASRDVSDHNDRMSIEGSERCCALMVRPIPMGRRRYAVGSEGPPWNFRIARLPGRSEEHTSELQSLMRISYAVFCLKKKKHHKQHTSAKQ